MLVGRRSGRANCNMDTREFFVEFTLQNACLTIFDDRYTRFRPWFTSLYEPIDAVVHGFTEYTQGYQRLTGIRAASPDVRARLLDKCERRETAIGVPFSCNNVYHQAFHAVPAWERWRQAASDAARQAGPSGVDFVPLVYPSAAVGKKMSVDPRRWHAWEFSIRPFTKQPYEALAARTTRLLNPDRCVCYDRVYANAPAFNPIARRSAPRMRQFRAQALANSKGLVPASTALRSSWWFSSSASAATATTTSTPWPILWVVRRHALRNIENDAKLRARIQLETALSQRIRRVEVRPPLPHLPSALCVIRLAPASPRCESGSRTPGRTSAPFCGVRVPQLETMTLSEQMHLFASASGLLAVHGQAMAWVMFLPSDERKTAAVEIFPMGLKNPIYQDLSLSLGTRYESLKAATAPGCGTSAKIEARLTCNVTVNVEKVTIAVQRMAAWTSQS